MTININQIKACQEICNNMLDLLKQSKGSIPVLKRIECIEMICTKSKSFLYKINKIYLKSIEPNIIQIQEICKKLIESYTPENKIASRKRQEFRKNIENNILEIISKIFTM